MMKNPFEAAAICIANLAFAFAFYNIFCRLLDQGIREMDRKQKLRRILCYPVFYISNTFLGLAHIHGLRKAAVFLLSLFLCALIGHRGRMENKVSICLTSGGYAFLVEMLSFEGMYLIELRIRCTMQRCTTTSLKMDFTPSSRPDTPSMLTKRMSSTPRALISSKICIQQCFPSDSPTQMPRISLIPSTSYPRIT